MNRPPPQRTVAFALLVLVGAGAAARFYGLELQSLWNDELSTWSRSNFATLQEVIDKGLRSHRHPPGYRFLLFGVIHAFGDSPTMLRLPSAIAGTLAIPLIFWLGRSMYGAKEGLVAAAILAATWAPLYYSQEATPYGVLLLLSIASSLAAWLLAQRLAHDRRVPLGHLVVFGLTAVLTAAVHYYGALLVALQFAALGLCFLRRGRALALVIAVGLAVALACAPWIPILIDQLAVKRPDHFPRADGQLAWRGLLLLNHQSAVFVFVFGAAQALVVLRWIKARDRTLAGAMPGLLLAAWLLLPVIVLYSMAWLYRPLLADRHLIIVLPAAVLLAARGIATLLPARYAPAVAIALCAGLLADLVFARGYYTTVTKQQFREVARHLDRLYRQDPDALVVSYVWSAAYLNYYLERLDSPLRVRHSGLGHERHQARLDQLIDQSATDRLIYATAHRRPRNKFLKHVASKGEKLEEHIFVGATLRVYDLNRE